MGLYAAQHLDKHEHIGKVYSIHKRVFNIETDNGMLIGIVDSSFGNYFVNIRVDFPIPPNLTEFITPKTDVFHHNNKIIIDSSPLEISLADTEVWTPQLNFSSLEDQGALKKRLNECKAEVLQYSRSQLNFLLKNLTIPDQRGHSGSLAYEKLIEGLVSYNLKLCLKALKHIIGLGPGWTPCWDDFLAGFFASLYLTNCQTQEKNPLNELLQQIEEEKHLSWPRTTPQSFQLIQLGLRGHLPEEHFGVLNHLLYGGSSNLLSLLSPVFQIGHTSGADMLVGILEGLRLFLTYFNKRDQFIR